MKFVSSSEPLYTVVLEKIDKDEQAAISSWALDNITGQMVFMTNNSGWIALNCVSKPEFSKDHFGRKNKFSERSSNVNSIIGFTRQEDLTAFLIMFESSSD